jgi:tetratricopeptide (TPR) repeat protein
MSKKSKSSKQKKNLKVDLSPADKLFNLIDHQIFIGDYTSAITNSERLLSFLPQSSPMRADVLTQLGIAHVMLKNYQQGFVALSEALELAPNSAEIWYNRGLSSLYTMRVGRAFSDFTRAVELNKRPELSEEYNESLRSCGELLKESLELRGPNFTLEQQIKQEDLYQRGLKLMEKRLWDQAARAFQESIAMGDCLPQPWGNLGICLMMQQRYDEAEAALKRALEIDPQYTIAKNNLTSLANTRRTGSPPIIVQNDPMRDLNIQNSVAFIQE